VDDCFSWVFNGLYGPNDESLWEELTSVRLRCDVAWFLVRDFNVVRFLCERLGLSLI
jgi:hypothetical protein